MFVVNFVSGFNILSGVCINGYVIPAFMLCNVSQTHTSVRVFIVDRLVSEHSSRDEQGFALGSLAAVQSIVSAFGPLVFGSLYSWAAADPINFPQAPFVLSAVLTAVSLSGAMFCLRPVLASGRS
jgi:MFS family permease